MIVRLQEISIEQGSFSGLRMTADEFLRIPDDGNNYELIDGVVIATPSPVPQHQRIVYEIAVQLGVFLQSNPIGEALVETDIHLGKGKQDIVYRPEMIFFHPGRMVETESKLEGAPDLVVEVVSFGSRRLDMETKKFDYERFRVREYWLIDPDIDLFTAFHLESGRFVETVLTGETYSTDVIPGFVLDLVRVRRKFQRRTTS